VDELKAAHAEIKRIKSLAVDHIKARELTIERLEAENAALKAELRELSAHA